MTCRAGHASCLSMLFVIPSDIPCHSDVLCHSERSEESGEEKRGRDPGCCFRSFTSFRMTKAAAFRMAENTVQDDKNAALEICPGNPRYILSVALLGCISL